MKKFFALSIIAVLSIATLAACGSQKTEPETPTTTEIVEEPTTTVAPTEPVTTTVAAEVYGECETVENEDGSISPKEVYKGALKGIASGLDEDPLNVRVGPSGDYIIVGSFVEGDELEIEAQYDGWGYVSVDGLKGWVSLDYVTLEEPAKAPAAPVVEEPAETEAASEEETTEA